MRSAAPARVLLVARSAPAVPWALALLAVGAGAGCPEDEQVLPRVEVSARVAPDAPAADPGDAPPVDGAAPAGMPESVQVIDLGLLGVEGGHTGDIFVDVTSLGALQVLVWGHPGASVILERALDPDGAAVVSDVEPDALPAQHLSFARGFPAQVFSVNRVLGTEQSGAFLVPNTPSVPALDGTWTLRVGQYAVDLTTRPPARTPVDRPVRVMLVARGPDTGAGHVDLNLHVTGSLDEAFLDAALDVVREAWAPVGLSLGAVRTRAVDPSLATVELAEGRCEGGQLDALLATGQGAPAGVDLFLVDGFVCLLNGGVDVGGAIGGLSAGIPGPAWVHGSRRSGVAVATGRAADDPLGLGSVMAHELGHFLGLYHTKESSSGGEPIEDEIEDSPAGDDADENLMYFAVGFDRSLSEGQGQVLRTSPFVIADLPAGE